MIPGFAEVRNALWLICMCAKFNENEVHKCLVMFDTLAG